jgi:hypothetical protein
MFGVWVTFFFMAGSIGRGAIPTDSRPHALPTVRLSRNLRGRDAIQALGERLIDVARSHGRNPAEFRVMLLRDRTLAIDRTGRLHYTEDVPPPDSLEATDEPRLQMTAAFAATETFRLHSRPSAKRSLYLDFNGHVLSGTAWNTSFNGGANITAPPFDIDGNPASFSEAEQMRIQRIWQRVSEDFAAFNIDVTTELASEATLTRSAASDLVFGVRVLISPISHLFGNYGGMAYVGVFDEVGDTYKTVLVFPERLATSEKNVAEAASHEAGHTMGLNHDGSTGGSAYYAGHGAGTSSWAPIMGNSYSKNVTQWCKGEYAGANNTQDDLAVMREHGLESLIDDHGNTPATATHLARSASILASGVIGLDGDIDVLSITVGAGPATLAVNPFSHGPNLDIAITLCNASGTVVGFSNPADQLSASLDLTLGAGTYYLHIRGAGNGSALSGGYSPYGSLGRYTVSGIVSAPGPAAPTNLRVVF